MGTASMPGQKVCTECGVDVAAKPRVKDQHGRYFCQPCHDGLKAKGAAGEARTAPRPATASASPAPAARPSRPAPAPEPAPAAAEGADDGILSLLENLPAVPVQGPTRCGGCGMPMGATAKVCTHCGFNVATGRQIQVGVGEEIVDETKKKGPKAYKSSREHDADESKYQKKMAYLKPGLTLAVCLGVVVAIAASKQLSIPLYVILLGIQAVATFLAYLVIAVAWVGFDEPFHIEFLRIAAVTSVAAIPNTMLVGVPIGWGGTMIVWGVFLMAMMVIMELEMDEAVIVGLIGGFVNFIASLVALWYLAPYF